MYLYVVSTVRLLPSSSPNCLLSSSPNTARLRPLNLLLLMPRLFLTSCSVAQFPSSHSPANTHPSLLKDFRITFSDPVWDKHLSLVLSHSRSPQGQECSFLYNPAEYVRIVGTHICIEWLSSKKTTTLSVNINLGILKHGWLFWYLKSFALIMYLTSDTLHVLNLVVLNLLGGHRLQT